MRASVFQYQGKEQAFADALVERGVELVEDPYDADVALMDYPAGWRDPRLRTSKFRLAQALHVHGVRVFSFPHGAGPMAAWDGLVDPWLDLTAELVHSEGHKQFMEMVDYPCPVEVIGWSYSPLVAFQTPEKVEKLLFAPIHPWADGENALQKRKDANSCAYQVFLDHPAKEKRVRMFGSHQGNGTWPEENVEYVSADLTLDWSDIDWADAVITHGTYAYLSVARGKPIVMFDQDTLHDDYGQRTVRTYSKWRDFVRYPFTIEDDANSLVRACVDSPELAEWRRLWIGEPLDGDRLVTVLESALVSA